MNASRLASSATARMEVALDPLARKVLRAASSIDSHLSPAAPGLLPRRSGSQLTARSSRTEDRGRLASWPEPKPTERGHCRRARGPKAHHVATSEVDETTGEKCIELDISDQVTVRTYAPMLQTLTIRTSANTYAVFMDSRPHCWQSLGEAAEPEGEYRMLAIVGYRDS